MALSMDEVDASDRLSEANGSEVGLDADEAGGDAAGTRAHETKERLTLARNESRAVGCWRVVVYLVVTSVAVMVSSGVYLISKNDQREDFESQFAAYADKVTSSFYDSIDRKFGAIQSFSTTITSFAAYSNSTFPFLTIPDFELHGVHNRIQSASVITYWAPLVTDAIRDGWEDYALDNRQWIAGALASETKWKDLQDERFSLGNYKEAEKTNSGVRNLEEDVSSPDLEQVTTEDGYNKRIFGTGGAKKPAPLETGPFLPLWQLTPVIPMTPFLNYDLLSHLAVKDVLEAAISSEQVVIGQAHGNVDPNDKAGESADLYDAFLVAGQYRHDILSYEGDPSTNIVVPVFDSFGPNRTLAGVLLASMYWRLTFSNVLPETAKGIICVLENSLNQSFTYLLNGREATFLGAGSLHDPKYEAMVVSEDVTKLLEEHAGPHNQGFDSAKINKEHCRYRLHVYPSQATEDEYVNSTPILYTVLVACVFLFTSLVFIAYDWLVARRQNVVKTKAVKSAAIVSSLYPEQVRDRLFKENDTPQKPASNYWKFAAREDVPEGPLAAPNQPGFSGLPIADYYKECTVLFADLVGFTHWSSTRKPEDVFFLLESLYQAFDRIAIRRRVFKVETVGDCYVAVTGVPEPQDNHAAIMVKFARDCYAAMNKLLPNLVDKVGEDTATLNIRVGLHSGAVTGGVLRGQKSRFQLFGDTINTASRMESNGVPGRIHISEATADRLRDHGLGKWVVPREDKIVAKGKGELQTYFVSIQRDARSMVSSVSFESSVAKKEEQQMDKSCETLALDHSLEEIQRNGSRLSV